MRPTLTIARTTFIEALRQPIVFVLIALAGMAILLTTWGTGFSLGYIEVGEVSGDNKLLLDLGMATVFVIGTLLAGFIATSAMSREIENKTVLTVVSKPVARHIVVVGKYLGVTAAVLIGIVTMAVFLLMAIRHKVMTSAADDPDWPVIIFSVSAFTLSVALGVWGNFFYGWSFAQFVVLALAPLMLVAYVAALCISPKWEFQAITKDFKPQISIALGCLALSMPVLCAIAVAASTRLGQVMTIVVCFIAFLLGLLSSTMFGRAAHSNTPLSIIAKAEPEKVGYRSFAETGHQYVLTLKSPPERQLVPGESIYYGTNPNGFDLAVPAFEAFAGDPAELARDRVLTARPAIVVQQYDAAKNELIIKHIGETPVPIRRPPQVGDRLFSQPTQTHLVPLALWSLVPNLQSFWLLDAVSQAQPIPGDHVLMVALYSLAQVIVFLAVAVMLFQRRDVG